MTDGLLPCPFCGESRTVCEDGEPYLHAFEQWQNGEKTGCFAVACTACGVQQCPITHDSEGDAIAAWNTRSIIPPVRTIQ